MTSALDYPDFVRPVADSETDAVLLGTTQLTGSTSYFFGPYGVSQAAMLRGNFQVDGPAGGWMVLRLQWFAGAQEVAEDTITFPPLSSLNIGTAFDWGVRVRGTSVKLAIFTSSAAFGGFILLTSSTRPGLGREMTLTQGNGGVLLDTGTVAIGASTSVNLIAAPVARAVALRGRINGPNGVLTLGVNYSDTVSLSTAIIYRATLTSGADVNVPEIPVPPGFLTVGVQNLDTAAHSYNVSLVDVS